MNLFKNKKQKTFNIKKAKKMITPFLFLKKEKIEKFKYGVMISIINYSLGQENFQSN